MLTLKQILTMPTTQLGKTTRFLVFQIRLWSHCARLLVKNRSTQQAAALSYHTIFGIIPLTIVILLIFQLSPAYKDLGVRLKASVYEQLRLANVEIAPDPKAPDETVMMTEYVDDIVNNFIGRLDEGSIALFSAVIVIWAALALLSTIEKAFNNIWYVARGRNLLHRIINFWALLTLGPLLLGLGIYTSTKYTALSHVINFVSPLLSYIIAAAAFFLLYFIMPNTKVQAKAAIWGAAVAALVWSLAKWGFAEYVTKFIPYSKVYGAMGLIPLGVLWVYISWLIVLFGLQLTFTTQHFKTLDAAEIAAARKTEQCFIANDVTVINIVREIAAAFQKKDGPLAPQVICSKLGLPAEFGEKILSHLVTRGIIVKVSEPSVGFAPASDPANIKLSAISEAVAAVSFAQDTADQPQNLAQIAQSQRSALARHNLRQILTDLQAPDTP